MIAYFDCFSGISGDMTLGALVDAGVPLSKLRNGLARLPVRGYELTSRSVRRAGMRATKVDVLINSDSKGHKSEFRKWKDIKKIIDKSTLSREIKGKGESIFRRLFEAEAKIHGRRYDTIHLHELGAVDCIVDIFGALIGLDILGVTAVCSSPLNLGSGSIRTEHGKLPVPAPASVELLKGIPVYSSDVRFELTTPTGAVLMSSLVSEFGPLPRMNIAMTGTGAGDRNFKKHPNILRLFIGTETRGRTENPEFREETDQVIVVETNIDDMNPQLYDYVMDQLFKAGALDVFLTQGMMKKNRPGIKLTVLCDQNKREDVFDIILRETSSIGLRFYRAGRVTLERRISSKNTRYGKVRFKESRGSGKIRKISAEYDDCKKIAEKFDIPLREVLKALS